ncbi:MAG: FecR family protein [Proteiniphilum sp.]|nr:FecR family protein [Proteiniphilum sp.]MDD3908380.1 FecR family protein [Proteiniphilum sp.]MDD4415781.1 FecR family protein [Proteiniphilum sp.]
MNEQLQDIKKLAFRYFEGNTTPEEAEILFSFLHSEKSNMSLFKSWENEWFVSVQNAPALNKKWDELKAKEQKTKDIRSFIPLKKATTHYALIAATVALLIIGGLFAILYTQRQSPEHFFTTHTPFGEKSRIVMPDGSIVWLNSGSSLTYSDKYGIKNRQVELHGEGYFEVEKGKQDFIVKTNDHSIVVKGTKFNVSAYPDDAILSTTLLEGRVELKYKTQSINMRPGETVEVDIHANTMTRVKSKAQASSIWTQNRLEYDQIQLESLLKKLSREYARPILLKNDSLKNQSFSISIDTKEDLTEVLKAISKIIPIKIINKNDTITLL